MSLEGELWEATEPKLYGLGAGRAHPSVEWVSCPTCEAPAGSLCRDDRGEPKLTRHVARCQAFREVQKIWRQAGLDAVAPRSAGRRTRQELLRQLRRVGR